MWHELETGEVHTGFWWGRLEGTRALGRTGVDGRIILNWSPRSGMGRHGLD